MNSGTQHHPEEEPIDLAECDRQFIARVRLAGLEELQRMLSSVREEWQWECVDRELRRRGARK